MCEYPFRNKYQIMSKDIFDELISKFKPVIITYIPKRMRYKNNLEKYGNKYLIIKEDWKLNEKLNNVTDFFSEQVRIHCKFKNHESPYEYWVKHKSDFENLSNEEFHDKIFSRTKFCNNFRISVALTIYKLFDARNILDISAGWGDRLIAAIGHKAESYTGVDPNDDLQKCYKNIIDTLSGSKNFNVIHDGFETVNLPKIKYDLVFSSPPFFDLEEYSKSERDSMNLYHSESEWYNKFLIPSLRKAYENLIEGGHLVLYIAESTNTHYIDDMVKYLSNLMKYRGSIYYYYEKVYKPRRMYVWKK